MFLYKKYCAYDQFFDFFLNYIGNEKNTRGASRGIATIKAIEKSGTTKLPVTIQMEELAAIGINAEKFASEIGVITRLNAPLTVKKWREVDNDIKEKICDLTLVMIYTLIAYYFEI